MPFWRHRKTEQLESERNYSIYVKAHLQSFHWECTFYNRCFGLTVQIHYYFLNVSFINDLSDNINTYTKSLSFVPPGCHLYSFKYVQLFILLTSKPGIFSNPVSIVSHSCVDARLIWFSTFIPPAHYANKVPHLSWIKCHQWTPGVTLAGEKIFLVWSKKK